MKELARFGPLTLSGFLAPASFSHSAETLLVEHKVAEGKPVLEWVGEELRKLEFELFLHAMIADPGEILRQAETMRVSGKAWPLIWQGGIEDGEWAIKSLKTTIEKCAPDGRPSLVKLTFSLIEAPLRQAVRTLARAPGAPGGSAAKPALAPIQTETLTNKDQVSFRKIKP